MEPRERGRAKKVVGKCALSREEENDPSGETIGAEMAKRMRDGHTHTHTNKHTSVREIYIRILPYLRKCAFHAFSTFCNLCAQCIFCAFHVLNAQMPHEICAKCQTVAECVCLNTHSATVWHSAHISLNPHIMNVFHCMQTSAFARIVQELLTG